MVRAFARLVLWEHYYTLSIVQTLFCQTIFCLTFFFLPSVLPAVNCARAHKTTRRYDGELPRNVLLNNLPYFRVLVPILFGKWTQRTELYDKYVVKLVA